MKNIILSVILLFIAFMTNAQKTSFLTYNIRYGLASDGENRWDLRKDGLAKQILFYEPDVFGVQEALGFQVSYLDSALQDYDYYGVGRDDGKLEGEYSAIFFKRDKYDLIQKSTFWLSETPDNVSVGWDAALPRICTVILLKAKSSEQFIWVLNTHFDHRGVLARKNSAQLIAKKIQEYNIHQYPLILMGDFNLEPDSDPIGYLSQQLNDSKHSCNGVVFGPEGTFNGFNHQDPLLKRIDYIFTDKQHVEVLKYAVLTDSKDLKYYSDHLPVYIETRFK